MARLMPDMTALLSDPDLGAVSFTIIRTPGKWVMGEFEVDEGGIQRIKAVGNRQPASDKALTQVPEGERTTGMMVIRTVTPMYQTAGTEGHTGVFSDEVIWRGKLYSVIHIKDWLDFGWNAVFLRLEGDAPP